jgi:16S rRNA (guanine966-N2)-methyltransferase
LSRGAASCLFVEQDRAALDALRSNAEKLEIRADIRAQSVLGLRPAAETFDLIMMDPPYGTGAGMVALDKLNRLGWIGPATWVSIETSASENITVDGFEIDVARNHGKARITLLRTGSA